MSGQKRSWKKPLKKSINIRSKDDLKKRYVGSKRLMWMNTHLFVYHQIGHACMSVRISNSRIVLQVADAPSYWKASLWDFNLFFSPDLSIPGAWSVLPGVWHRLTEPPGAAACGAPGCQKMLRATVWKVLGATQRCVSSWTKLSVRWLSLIKSYIGLNIASHSCWCPWISWNASHRPFKKGIGGRICVHTLCCLG